MVCATAHKYLDALDVDLMVGFEEAVLYELIINFRVCDIVKE